MSDAGSAVSGRERGLSDFEGTPVIRAGMEIPGAAGGLREPLSADPIELHIDDDVFAVFHLRVAKVRFDPIKDSDDLTRVHVTEVVNATLVDGDLVGEQLAEQAKRVAAAKRAADAARGINELPLS